MNTTHKFNLRPLVAALILAVFHPAAHAIKLGDPVVMSHVGEPLRISIPVVETTTEELASLSVHMATQVNYMQSEISPPVWLKNANVTMERKNGAAVVHVTAGVQVDPIADVMLELRWAAGRMLQTVPVFLEPSKNNGQKEPIVAPALTAPQPLPATQTTIATTVGTEPISKTSSKELPPQNDVSGNKKIQENNDAQTLKVKKGDTLLKLMRPRITSEASLEQLLVAYTKHNPQAFANGNMNRLRAGVILKAPSADTIATTSQAEAKEFILAQSRNFGDYSDKLAKQVTEQAPLESKNPSQKASGKITGRVEDGSKQAQAVDRLTLSKASGDKSKASEGRSGKREVTEEDRIAMRFQLEEAKARLAELEQIVEAQKKLQALKNAAMAQAQAQAEKAKVTQAAPKVNPPVATAIPQEKPEDQVLTPAWILDVLANNTLPILGSGLVLASLLLVRARRTNPDIFKFLNKHQHSTTDTFREILPKMDLRSRIHPMPQDDSVDELNDEPKFSLPEYDSVLESKLKNTSEILNSLPDMPPLEESKPNVTAVTAPRVNIKFVAPVAPKVDIDKAVEAPLSQCATPDPHSPAELDLSDIDLNDSAVEATVNEPAEQMVPENKKDDVVSEVELNTTNDPVVAPFNFSEEVKQIESAALNFLDAPVADEDVDFTMPAVVVDSSLSDSGDEIELDTVVSTKLDNTEAALEITFTEPLQAPSVQDEDLSMSTVMSNSGQDQETSVDDTPAEQGLDIDGKLALAKLYVDLGDINGARELLLELIELDDGVSSIEAKELLATLNT